MRKARLYLAAAPLLALSVAGCGGTLYTTARPAGYVTYGPGYYAPGPYVYQRGYVAPRYYGRGYYAPRGYYGGGPGFRGAPVYVPPAQGGVYVAPPARGWR